MVFSVLHACSLSLLMGYAAFPLLFLGLFGWRTARITVFVNLLGYCTSCSLRVADAALHQSIPLLEIGNILVLLLSLQGSAGLVGWREKNWRVTLLCIVAVILSGSTGLFFSKIILPMFMTGSTPLRIVSRVVVGMPWMVTTAWLGVRVVQWSVRQQGVATGMMGNWWRAQIAFTLRLLQASQGDAGASLIMELLLQAVQMTERIVLYEFGGWSHLAKKLRGVDVEMDDGRWWDLEDNVEQAMVVASHIVFRDLLDLAGALSAMYIGLVMPFTFDGQNRSFISISLNGFVQINGALFAKIASDMYLRARVTQGARVFEVYRFWPTISRVDKMTMFLVLACCALVPVSVFSNQLCWTCSGQWRTCDAIVE